MDALSWLLMHLEFAYGQKTCFKSLTLMPSDIQCFTVQPVLDEHPRFKNKPVPDQIIK